MRFINFSFTRNFGQSPDTGLAVSTYIQMDDTSARVNGVNYYSHILCSDSFISYFTEKNKDKLTLLKILIPFPYFN